MKCIILSFDNTLAEELLRGQRKMLPWIKNFKKPVDKIVVAIRTPVGQVAIGSIMVESKAWISKYTASSRILRTDLSLPKMYWYDFSNSHKVCLFTLSDIEVFEKPERVENLIGYRNIGSGVYFDDTYDGYGCDYDDE